MIKLPLASEKPYLITPDTALDARIHRGTLSSIYRLETQDLIAKFYMQRPGASDEDTDTSTIDERVGGLVKPGCSRVHCADWASFERESSALACLAHDHIIRGYAQGSITLRNQPFPYTILEYLKGRTLFDEVAKDGTLGAERIVTVAIGLCAALGYAHAQGIIHKDVKPSNIVMGLSGVKLIDFGCAVQFPEPASSEDIVQGTPNYMSPEQVRGEDLDQRTDVYSVGMTLFFAVIGRVPFGDGSYMTRMNQKLVHEIPDPLSINSQIPPYLGRIIARACLRKRTERYQTVSDLLGDLLELPRHI